MRFLTWLRSEKWSNRSVPHRGLGASRGRATARPRLELLEERRVLSTLTVTNNTDYLAGSLRGELAAAQPGDTIVFDPSLDGQTIQLGGQLEINKNLTIQGPGAGLLAIDAVYSPSSDGFGEFRVFRVDAGANVTISGLTIEGGTGAFDGYGGGGILNLGTLTLSGSTVTGNNTDNTGWQGGGIYNAGTMTLSCSTVTDNTASFYTSGYGGGIYNAGTMTLRGSTVTDNTASWAYALGYSGYSYGGGIYNNGTMTLSGSTVTGNSAGLAGAYFSKGGGIFNGQQGSLTILSSVVLNNTASDGADICSLGSIKISKDGQVGKVSHK
jgi:hypothetical protein